MVIGLIGPDHIDNGHLRSQPYRVLNGDMRQNFLLKVEAKCSKKMRVHGVEHPNSDS